MIQVFLLQVAALIIHAANQYHLMREKDSVNFWSYVRSTAPELCSLHSIRLFPDDKVYTNMMKFINTRIERQYGYRENLDDILDDMSTFIALRSGHMAPYVRLLLQTEKTPTRDGYLNVLNGVLSIRFGCDIGHDYVKHIRLKDRASRPEAICYGAQEVSVIGGMHPVDRRFVGSGPVNSSESVIAEDEDRFSTSTTRTA